MKAHVHDYSRGSIWGEKYHTHARCTICGRYEPLVNLVYLGDAPRSVGTGSAWK